jgi:hypothetical protein
MGDLMGHDILAEFHKIPASHFASYSEVTKYKTVATGDKERKP